jgi:dTDP-4-amino-4,6-dideoxygalactose transaminase
LSRLSRDSAGQSQPIIEQTAYRFRLVVPDLPQPESFLPYLQAVHDSGWFTNFGPLVRRLERELERIFGRNGEICVSASSATAGLSAALLALECKGGCWCRRSPLQPQQAPCSLGQGLEIRRYYYPSLSQWPQIRAVGACAVSESLADRMCALPIRGDVATAEADEIVKIAVAAVKCSAWNRESHQAL